MATHYNSSSRGLLEIATMPYPHALNARDKLARECARIPELGGKIERQDELDALNVHIAGIEAMSQEAAEL